MNVEQAKKLTKDDYHKHAASLHLETRMLIGGELFDASSGKTFESTNPANGDVLATIPLGDAGDVDRAVAAARKAFKSGVWSRLEPRERMNVLYRTAKLIEDNALQFALIESLDVGKPIADVLGYDVAATALTFQFFGETIDKIEGIVTNTASDAFHYILRQPLGVVAAIAPWNYPLVMAAWKTAPALAAGNCVVLKPAQISPLSATLLAQLFLEAGGPPGVFNVVHGTGGVVGKALALHMDVDKIGFTGSTEIGKQMLVYAGESNMKRVTVETGGKSPQIVTAQVPDLDTAVRYAVNGIYSNKGETCSAGSRILVDATIHDEFVERFKAVARASFVPGDPLDPATTLGPLAGRKQQQTVLEYIDIGKNEGAHLAMGGGTPAGFEAGAYVDPTLFTGVNDRMRIAREEIFGPVCVAIPFRTIDEAIEMANDSIYGLTASVWTSDLSSAHKIARDLDAGVIWVNCYDHTDMTQPWGGFKQSGTGRDKCLEALLNVTQTKSVWVHLG
jgi:acyl-CoA reductase-like NAD-dependent aldehyde dehydrogenase